MPKPSPKDAKKSKPPTPPAPVRDVRVPTTLVPNFLQCPTIVKVVVGPEGAEQMYFVHESLLVERSHFFNRALNGKWRESDDKTVLMPDDEPEIVLAYLQLLYTGNLPIQESPRDKRKEFEILIELYILADKLQDPKSMNLVIDAFLAQARANKGPAGMRIANAVFDGTSEGSRLRALVVDHFVDRGGEGAVHGKWGEPHPEFLFQLSRRLLVKKKDLGVGGWGGLSISSSAL
ncbi:hypothetical protein K458DRAFT_196227 [Lentithecium fluviatile CBS 122367]|uniref:BTB domain-containing protein n=1 Tax=Lentithecium fluviatile CBS 122367 TaxID=1168545 RepID=A0A6G1IDB4_9PLEO|nr:hypothetical protein K458DRAFT_196227 [Lentithecium fluviatile CBS 122367]